MIALRDVTVTLPAGIADGRTVLDSITLDIPSGEWTALLGANGSGKTTLLHTLAGLIPVVSGRVDYALGPQGTAGPGQTPRISLLLQEPDNQFITTSVRHELELSASVGSVPGAAARRVVEAVEKFALGELVSRNPHRLSGGEKQRLALATVWLQNPELLLLDEPTAYLDDEAAALCREFVSQAHRDGATIVWATPGGDELSYAGKIVCLGDGRVLFGGTIDDLYAWAGDTEYDFVRPAVRELAEQIAGAVGTPGNHGRFLESAGSSAAVLADGLATLIVAETAPRDTGAAEQRGVYTSIPDTEAVVRMKSVDFAFDDEPVLRGVDLVIGRGECVGLAGNNGAGKTTVLGLAAGVHQPRSGELRRLYTSPTEGNRQNVFYLFQSPERLFFAETVSEELSFGLKRLGLSPDEIDPRCRTALETVELEPAIFLPRAPLTLSPGEMRRVAFAIVLSLEPQFLLLDEPTSCLDPGGRGVAEAIVCDRQSRGVATLIASHDASFLAGVCDKIVWLKDGGVDASVETSGGTLAPGEVWHSTALPILVLQDRLAALGVNVVPRELTARGFVARVAPR